jgi:hypothetical protein
MTPINQNTKLPLANEYHSISSLLKKPESGGIPEIANAATKNVYAV